MQGSLFAQDSLSTGIADTPVWTELPDSALDAFVDALRLVYSPFDSGSEINEAVTEDEIIVKTLGLLGWNDLALPQVTASGS